MADTKDLRELAAIIRDETGDAQNTANRVGTLLMLLAERAETGGESTPGPGKAGLPVISLEELNASPTDKTSLMALMTDPTKVVQVVTDSKGVNVGVLLQYSDNMRHVLTQQLYSHFSPPTGESQKLGTHNHNRVICMERSISYKTILPILTAQGVSQTEDFLKTVLSLSPAAYHIAPEGNGRYYAMGYWTPWRDLAGEIASGTGSGADGWRELLTLA